MITKINKITPQGFCGGVINALKILDKALDNKDIPHPIYMIGQIIHNKHIIDNYLAKGVILLSTKDKTKLELIDEIKSGTIIFSAHGVSPQVYEKAKQKNLYIIDTTCPNVNIVKKNIMSHLNDGYKCLYIGTKGHPECEAILGISSDIKLISSIDDVTKENNDKLYITNQTTLSIFDIKHIYEKIKELNPNIIIDDKICNATTIRQEALAKQEHVDLCIIVGDKMSSNTKKLYSVSRDISKVNTILIENAKELENISFANIKTVSISSGASTPSYLVDETIEYLKTVK